MRDCYHPTYVLAPHDDGTCVRATLLSQHRVAGVWRVTCRSYSIQEYIWSATSTWTARGGGPSVVAT